MQIPKYWIKAIVRNPSIAKWYLHWRDSLNGKHTPLEDELPWMTYRAIDWLSHHLTHDMILFEWGSGGSTTFFSRRVKRVITIEHDPIWYQEVVNALEKRGYKNISLRLVEPVAAKNINPWYTSTDVNYTGKCFESYIKAIDEYPDSFFDVVVVDGRARAGCIRQALPKIKPGGYLILDNSERVEYKLGLDLVPKHKDIQLFGPGPYSGISWETRIIQIQNMS